MANGKLSGFSNQIEAVDNPTKCQLNFCLEDDDAKWNEEN